MTDLTPDLTVAFLLFPQVTQLDLTGPAQVLARLGRARIELVWHSLDPVPTDAGFSIVPTATFAGLPATDILCVPGGMGVNGVIADDAAMAWVTQVGQAATWVTSVCTGSLILGAAGLLAGYRAGCHWGQIEQLRLFGAEPDGDRVVIDRNRMTGGGVTAGIDFALTLTAMLRGEAHAKAVQLSLQYAPSPPFAAGTPDEAGPALVDAYRRGVARVAPHRDAELRALALRRGFG